MFQSNNSAMLFQEEGAIKGFAQQLGGRDSDISHFEEFS